MRNFLIFVLLVILLLVVPFVQAGERMVKVSPEYDEISIQPVCVGGYVFVLATSARETSVRGVSLVQMMEGIDVHRPPQPVRCAE